MPPNSIGFHCNIVFFIVLRRRSCGVPFGELEKIISLMQYKKKLIISGTCFFVETFQFRNFKHPGLLLPKGNYGYCIIYTLFYGRDQIPFRTTYIEYRSPVKIVIHFIGFHCKNMFFVIVPRHRSWGIPIPSVSLKNSFLNTIWKEIDHFGGPVSCWNVLVYGLQTSRGATPQRELRIWYILIYTRTLLHGRDRIPFRTTYIEYRSPAKIVNHFFRNIN